MMEAKIQFQGGVGETPEEWQYLYSKSQGIRPPEHSVVQLEAAGLPREAPAAPGLPVLPTRDRPSALSQISPERSRRRDPMSGLTEEERSINESLATVYYEEDEVPEVRAPRAPRPSASTYEAPVSRLPARDTSPLVPLPSERASAPEVTVPPLERTAYTGPLLSHQTPVAPVPIDPTPAPNTPPTVIRPPRFRLLGE